MEFARSLRRLWRHPLFRRLLAVRIATQSSDGLLQIALASYVLFSPERQAGAGSIAAVLAVTLLPFSVLGPFVGVVLDRWSRRQVMVGVDLTRSVLGLGLAALSLTGVRHGWVEIAFYGIVLLAMSLNRFLLAALSAALPHTIDADEYMVANSVVPTVGPAGALLGAAIGTGLRLILGAVMPASSADAVLFAVVGCGFVVSASLALRIGRHALGPDPSGDAGTGSTGEAGGTGEAGEPARARDVAAGLAEALRHLRERPAAGLGLLTIGAHRVVYGVVFVATILVYRNYFHTPAEVDPAIADLGLLVGVTGAGFVLAAALTPPVSKRIGVRAWMIASLVGSAVLQVFPGTIYAKPAQLVAAFGLGIFAQSIKICVDTIVQTHVEDELKGRVFVLYDMVFNVALVLAATIGALILPADGKSVTILVVLACVYLVIAVAFGLLGRGLDLDRGVTRQVEGEYGDQDQARPVR